MKTSELKTSLSLCTMVIFLGLLCATSVDARRRHVTATGRVFCSIDGNSHPLEFVTVKLKDKDTVFDDTFGSTRSDSSGYFTVSGSARDLIGNPDPYIQVEYEYSGAYGRMEVQQELLGLNRKDSTSTTSIADYINFGSITFNNDHCNAYVMTYSAMEDYGRRTATPLPYSRLKVVTHAPIHGGTPYSTTDKIRIPSGDNYDFETAKHELAHTVRHSLDGSFLHFLSDVVKYTYTQTHTCGKLTNKGFAFNEGWAEFWAGTCFGIYGNSPTDYSYEGNVAKALRTLKANCGTSDGQMIDVLQRNPRSIHSFDEYASAHHDLTGCN